MILVMTMTMCRSWVSGCSVARCTWGGGPGSGGPGLCPRPGWGWSPWHRRSGTASPRCRSSPAWRGQSTSRPRLWSRGCHRMRSTRRPETSARPKPRVRSLKERLYLRTRWLWKVWGFKMTGGTWKTTQHALERGKTVSTQMILLYSKSLIFIVHMEYWA